MPIGIRLRTKTEEKWVTVIAKVIVKKVNPRAILVNGEAGFRPCFKLIEFDRIVPKPKVPIADNINIMKLLRICNVII